MLNTTSTGECCMKSIVIHCRRVSRKKHVDNINIVYETVENKQNINESYKTQCVT